MRFQSAENLVPNQGLVMVPRDQPLRPGDWIWLYHYCDVLPLEFQLDPRNRRNEFLLLERGVIYVGHGRQRGWGRDAAVG